MWSTSASTSDRMLNKDPNFVVDRTSPCDVPLTPEGTPQSLRSLRPRLGRGASWCARGWEGGMGATAYEWFLMMPSCYFERPFVSRF